MGEGVSELGFSPDPDKISAIHSIPTPIMHAWSAKVIGHDQLPCQVYSKHVWINCSIAILT